MACELIAAPSAAPPQRLSDTGLYVAGSTTEVRPGIVSFTPQYPLWSDGADKRRWICAAAGHRHRRVAARTPGSSRPARGCGRSSRSTVAGRDALHRAAGRRLLALRHLRLERGRQRRDCSRRRAASPRCRARGTPGGRYAIPSRADCLALPRRRRRAGARASARCSCRPTAIRSRRTPAAARATSTCARSSRAAWLRNLPPRCWPRRRASPPRSPIERAALGYLHGNCGHCHNDGGSACRVG